MVNYSAQLDDFRRLPDETEWLEFKEARKGFETDALGRYVSALSNEANLLKIESGWLILGVKDKIDPTTGSRPVVGSLYAKSVDLNSVKL